MKMITFVLPSLFVAACVGVGADASPTPEDPPLTTDEKYALKIMWDGAWELRTRTVEDVERESRILLSKAALDGFRSDKKIGYLVWNKVTTIPLYTDHFFDGKLVRRDGPATEEMQSVFTKTYGKPKKGPLYKWMQSELVDENKIDEQWHWKAVLTLMRGGKEKKIALAIELSYPKIGSGASRCCSVIDTEQAEKVNKARNKN